MPIKVGDRLPEATFKVKTENGIEDVTTSQLCTGRTVVVFAVPGAFTPTCHLEHVPSFLANLEALGAKGVDEVICVAVNDPFVMEAWGKATGAAGRIRMLADGNATFTRAIGMDFDGSALGLGTRSKRYAMLVRDGVVEILNVEDNPGEVEASAAEKILEAL